VNGAGMNTPAPSTTIQRSSLLPFRQALYDHVFTRARDALFETLDALLLGPGLGSFVELALVPVFRRRWPSLYAALAEGQLDRARLERLLLRQIPAAPVVCFALDSTVWPHPQARTLPERQYYPLAGAGKPIVPGHAYSLLAWVAASGTSWALPVSAARIPPTQTAAAVGVTQVERLCQHYQERPDPPLVVVAADGSYLESSLPGRGARPAVSGGGAAAPRPGAVSGPRPVCRAGAPPQTRGALRLQGARDLGPAG